MDVLEAVDATAYSVTAEEAERHSRYRFWLERDGRDIGDGTVFTGARSIRPWIELHLETTVDPESQEQQRLFEAFADGLEPGSHLMVHYLGTETADALTADVPPPATPLGYLMWQAGFRWFKDWYFTEGWMEGSQKLQGNLPVDAATRKEREEEAEEALDQFLERDGSGTCKTLARDILATL